jgi:chromate transporter
LYYLRLGAIGFGGPVALVGQMEKELVQERQWLTKEEFREGVAVCQSLPGPLAIQGRDLHFLHPRRVLGGMGRRLGFHSPQLPLVAALGALYVYFDDLPPVKAIFYGVSPAVIGLISYSCYRLAKLGMEDHLQWVIAAGCFIVTVVLQAEVAVLFIIAGAIGIAHYGTFIRRRWGAPTLPLLAPLPAKAAAGAAPMGPILSQLLIFFLKAGSLTFGSGLVIVPFLEKGLVQQTGWLNGQQFLVAVAMGMLSPGPVVITATFVGWSRGFGGLWCPPPGSSCHPFFSSSLSPPC